MKRARRISACIGVYWCVLACERVLKRLLGKRVKSAWIGVYWRVFKRVAICYIHKSMSPSKDLVYSLLPHDSEVGFDDVVKS